MKKILFILTLIIIGIFNSYSQSTETKKLTFLVQPISSSNTSDDYLLIDPSTGVTKKTTLATLAARVLTINGANLTQEEVEDIIGNMVTGNTEVGITVTYNDTTGKLNFTVATPTDTNIGTNDLSLTENRILDLNGKVLLFSSGGYDMLTLGYGNVRKAEFSVPLNIPDDTYGVGWNGSTETATKNSIYDKIESLSLGGSGVTSVQGKTGIVTLIPDDFDDTSSTNKFITAAKLSAIDVNTSKVGITPTQSSNITTNNAKISNATHTGDVIGSTALTISNNAITSIKILDGTIAESDLNISNSASYGYSLTSDGSNGFTWSNISGGGGTDAASGNYVFTNKSGNETLNLTIVQPETILGRIDKMWRTYTTNLAEVTVPGNLPVGWSSVIEAGSATDSILIKADTGVDIYGQGNVFIQSGTGIDGLWLKKGRTVALVYKGANSVRAEGPWNVATLAPPIGPELIVSNAASYTDEENSLPTDNDQVQSPLSATITSIAEGTNGVGSYVINVESTNNTFGSQRHFLNNVENGGTYYYKILVRQTVGTNGRFSFTNTVNNQLTPLSSSTWTEYTGEVTTTSTQLVLNVYATTSSGNIGDTVQYKYSIKKKL